MRIINTEHALKNAIKGSSKIPKTIVIIAQKAV